MRDQLVPAYILHQRAYRDTSLILDIFTREQGLIAAVAKGARRPKSPFRSALQPFTPLLAATVGRRDLLTLTRLDVDHYVPRLNGNRLVAGFYLNEILMRVLPRAEPHEGLYDAYAQALVALQHTDIATTLRLFELALLKDAGYELMLDQDADSGEAVKPDARYLYIIEHGPVQVEQHSKQGGLIIQGETLIALSRGQLEKPEQLKQARQLLAQALKPLLGSKPLQSRALWRTPARVEDSDTDQG